MKTFFILGLSLIAQLTLTSLRAQERRVELVSQASHTSTIRSIAYSPDGTKLASGDVNGKIKLWDVESGIQLRSFTAYGNLVNTLAFSHDGSALVSAGGGRPGEVKLWEVKSGRELWRVESGGLVAALSPDGKLLANDSSNNNVELRDAASGRLLRTLSGQAASLTFSPDGRMLASGSGKSTITLWDVGSGKLISRRSLFPESEMPIWAVNFSPNGRILTYAVTTASPTLNNLKVILWDLASGRELMALDGYSVVSYLKFSPDGKTLAIENNGVADIRNVATGKHLRYVASQQYSLNAITFSPDGKTFAGGGDLGGLSLWNTATWEKKKTFDGQSEWRDLMAFSRDGRSLATVDHRETIKLWDLASGKWPRVLDGGYEYIGSALAFSHDGKILASGNTKVKLWDTDSGQELRELVSHEERRPSIQSIAFSPDGKLLATGSWKSVDLWNLTTGQLVRTWRSTGYVKCVAFSPDGRFLLSGSRENGVRLWELSSGQELPPETNSYRVNSAALSPDGKMLACAGSEQINLFNVKSSKWGDVPLSDDAEVMSVVFSPDGLMLASLNAEHTVKLWELSSGTVKPWPGGRLPAWVTFDRLARTPTADLIGYVEKEQVRLSDVRGKKEVAALSSFGENDWLVVTPDGLFDGSPTSWRRLIWRFDNSTFDYAPVEAFFREFYHPDLLGAITSGQELVRPERNLAEVDIRQPRITFTEVNGRRPNEGGPQAERSAVIKFEVSDNDAHPWRRSFPRTSGVQDLRLFRNGSLVRILPGDVFGASNGDVCKVVSPGGRKKVCAVTVPLVAGANLFTAYAFNHDNVKSDDATLAVTGAESLRRRGRLHVLAIGVAKYANARYDLNYTSGDVQDFSAEMRHQQERVGQYELVESVTLLNEEATKERIVTALRRLAESVQPEDGVVIYFSGHGTAQGDRFYLIPHDLGYDGPRTPLSAPGLRSILAHSISDLDLETAFRGIDVGRFLLIIDACNSGQALEAEEKRRGPMNSKGLAQLAYEKGMYILTASQSYELAFESDALKRSYLTYALVEEGLRQGAADRGPADGQLLLREWFDYATVRVPQLRQEKTVQTAGQRSQSLDEVTGNGSSGVQRPRVFYRREPEAAPFIIAKTGSSP